MNLQYTEEEARILAKFDAETLGIPMNPYSAKNPRLKHLYDVYEQEFEAVSAKLPVG